MGPSDLPGGAAASVAALLPAPLRCSSCTSPTHTGSQLQQSVDICCSVYLTGKLCSERNKKTLQDASEIPPKNLRGADGYQVPI